MAAYKIKSMDLTRGWFLAAGFLLLGGAGVAAHADQDPAMSIDPAPGRADASAADNPAAEPWVPMLLAVQYTSIHQHLDAFGAKYSSPRSFPAAGDDATSQTVGGYFGVRMGSDWQAYLDVERLVGSGVGGSAGLGSPPDGDVVHAGNGLPKDFYVARAYAEYLLPLGDGRVVAVRAQDQLPGDTPTSAFLFKVGKLSAGDDFDQNRYSNSARTQFMSWTLVNDGAWDYAADTRGYTGGLVFGYLQPAWSLKFGLYRMPQRANQEALEWPLTRAHGDNLELDLMPNDSGTVVRMLVYRNVARMGIYQDAINKALATGGTPDIVADDTDGREKYGIGFNLEQPLADEGDTGLFLRAGWNDGQTESFAFTEVDRALSFGGQVSGTHWGREEDRLGIAIVIDGLSTVHQRYLGLGGCGFELCDGALNYGHEEILEAYYRWQAGKYVQLSPDFLFYGNPGYNRDRGPARIYGLRLHLQY